MILVATYCRVSTDKDDQANSFESQQRYFREYIRNHPDWELYAVYADEGVSGTDTKKRTQFNKMIDDAYRGRFQLILTKEVSRFSRNILDTITYTRELKAIGVGVQFTLEGINTMNPDAEMYLSIMGSIAQEESRKTSARVVWGQTRQMEKGVVFGHSLLGYDVKDGQIHINPEEAEIVRLIFHKYALEQVSTVEIAGFLREMRYRTHYGNPNWTAGTIIKILKNEKYTGDLIQKKTYTPDFLTHAKKTNKGEVPLLILENHHQPIVSRKLWDLAQARLQRNNKHGKSSGHSNKYVFSGKIKCGECGSSYVGRFKYLKDGRKLRRWSCGTAAREGKSACKISKLVRDDDAMYMLKTAIRYLEKDIQGTTGKITELVMESIQEGNSTEEVRYLETELRRIASKKEKLMDSYFSGEITKSDMLTMKKRYERQMDDLQFRKAEKEIRTLNAQNMREIIHEEIIGILEGKIESEAFYKQMLHHLTVYKDRHMELHLNGFPQVFYFVESS